MFDKKIFMSALAASALIGAPALAAATVGTPAPTFTAKDSAGETHNLADYRGKTVVLEWTNAECPFVQKHYSSGNMQKLQANATSKGVVWLTVNSGAAGKQGAVDGAGANAIMKKNGSKASAYLLDNDGKIGRAYGATTTPHMYVIDKQGTLVYAGGIDDTPSADPADIPRSRNFVNLALSDLAAGKPVTTSTARSYGCSVKY